MANKRLGLNSVLFFLPQTIAVLTKHLTTPISQISHKESATTTLGDSMELVKFGNYPIDVADKPRGTSKGELPALPTSEGELLRDFSRHEKETGIERLEGPKEYSPFLPVDDDIIPTDQSGKQIFNPFQPISSPSASMLFDFSSRALDDIPTPQSEINITYPALATPQPEVRVLSPQSLSPKNTSVVLIVSPISTPPKLSDPPDPPLESSDNVVT